MSVDSAATRPEAETRLSLARAFLRVFIWPLLGVALLMGLFTYQMYQLIDDSRWVEHSDQVMLGGYQSLSAMLNMESGLRGYLLTDRIDFLQPFIESERDARDALDRLARLVADNPSQAARIADVRTEASAWMSWANDVLERKKKGEDYLIAVKDGAGRQRIDRVRRQLEQFFAEETELHAQRILTVRRARATTIVIGLTVFTVGALLFVFVARREMRSLTATYADALATVRQQQLHLQQARDDAESANRAKDLFLATVSHELRNPLNPILMWSVLLREPRLEPEKQQRASEAIEQNVKTLAQLIDDLLDIARIEAGKMRLDVAPVELQRVIEAVVQTVHPTADAKQVRLRVVLDPGAGPIAGDPGRLQQVVWNLLSNAVKFTPKGGAVQVTLARVNSEVELTVADTGQGIAPELLSHIFDPFWQGESGSTRRRGGLGLGLSIVRHLVELHAGTVSVHSAGVGKGAVFKIRFPIFITARDLSLDQQRANSRSEPAGEPTIDRLDGVSVLVVDDDRSSADAVAALLTESGADVRVAVSAEDALASLTRCPPDVLLSDIEMPGEDGYSLIRRVRARPQDGGGEIPAVALTAYARVEDRIKALEAGFHMHVTKPVNPAELVAVVASLARRALQPSLA